MGSPLFTFLIALCGVLALTPLVRRLALRIGALDPVVVRSVHQEPKPYLGGVAIYAAFVAAMLLTGGVKDRGAWGVILVGGLICAVGLLDDLRRPRGIPAGTKFLLQIAAALLLVFGFGVRIDWVRNPLAGAGASPLVELGYLAVPATVLWLVAFTNIVNLVDGLDGLAAGIAGIGSLTLLVVALGQGQPNVVILAAALAGATAGFLRYNFNPAKIFMGDAGALFLGFALGALSVHGVLKSAATVAVAVPVLAFAVPILDTAMAILRRLTSGRSLGEADRNHIHHRLLQLGVSHRTAVLVLWAVSAWLGLSAVAVTEVGPIEALIIMLFTGAGAALAVRQLGRLRLPGAGAASRQGASRFQ